MFVLDEIDERRFKKAERRSANYGVKIDMFDMHGRFWMSGSGFRTEIQERWDARRLARRIRLEIDSDGVDVESVGQATPQRKRKM